MKHLIFLIGFCLTLSVSAQQAHFSSSNNKEKKQNTVVYKCVITGLTASTGAQGIADKMKTMKPVVKVEVSNVTSTKAEFRIETVKEDNVHNLQNALTTAGIREFYLDGKLYKTADMFDVIKSMKKK